jgi:transposase
MSKNRQYDDAFKVQAIKLAKEIGTEKAAKELNVPSNTIYGWVKKAKLGGLDIGTGERSPEDVLNIAQENQQLKKQIKAMEKEIKRLNEMNEFLEDAAAFFAASRQKSGKTKD